MRVKRRLDPADLTRQLAEDGPAFEVAEAAAVCRVGPSKFHQWARVGVIKTFRLPACNKVFVERAELRRFLAEARQAGAAP